MNEHMRDRSTQPLRGPTSKYPKPPYKKQTQPWPGLACKMDPPPDHGEESYPGSGRLLGRKALITGGDSGMGRAAAIAYAREGADVAINYFPNEEEDAQQVVRLIKDAGRMAVALPGDLRDEAFCKKLVEDAIRALGRLDIIVSNAGRQQTHESILDISSEDFDATMKTNIYAPFWIIKAALPHLRPGAVIVATTSEQAYDPSPELYDYAQTKAATMNFVKSLAKQLGPKASASMASPQVRSGRRCRFPAAQRWISSNNSAATHLSAAPASQPSSRRSMSSLRPKMGAMPPGRFMVRRAAAANRSRQLTRDSAQPNPLDQIFTQLLKRPSSDRSLCIRSTAHSNRTLTLRDRASDY
jgi:NAD(P)-dependent dehydrogenase (short-subunit alcohol dehydrogenase family)